jgi:hypothetical protein
MVVVGIASGCWQMCLKKRLRYFVSEWQRECGKRFFCFFFSFLNFFFPPSPFLYEIPSLFIGKKNCFLPFNCLVPKQPKFTLVSYFFHV